MNWIAELFAPGHSIAWDYISSFSLLHEMLQGIHELVLSLDKEGYEEVREGVWVSPSAVIAPTAFLGSPCIIGDGAEIRHGAFIRGDAVIGAGAVIGNSVEVKNAIISDHAEVPHFNYVGDSILGYRAHMGAGSITSNVRSDRNDVIMHLPEGDVDTGRMKVGAFIGDRAEIGCNAVLNPGTVIGHDSVVYPLSSVRGTVPSMMIAKGREIIPRERIQGPLKEPQSSP